jgi:uncharacterized membrane protein
MSVLMDVLAALLAVTGGILSFYFYGIYCRWFSPSQKWVPVFCRMETQSCTSIVDSTYGRLFFGVPNAFWGIFAELGLAELIAGVIIGLWPRWIPLIVTGLYLIIGLWLIVGLIRLRVACPVCITVHSLNLIIFLLLLLT